MPSLIGGRYINGQYEIGREDGGNAWAAVNPPASRIETVVTNNGHGECYSFDAMFRMQRNGRHLSGYYVFNVTSYGEGPPGI